MPDSKTYTGGCHCGQVRFECTTDLSMVTACNCSICTKKGLHFTFLDPKSFQLRAGVSCIDGIELSKLTMTPMDGKSM